MKDLIIGLFKNLSSKKFFACLVGMTLLAVMGIWCLYKLDSNLATQAFLGCVGALTGIFTAFCVGNVVGDHYGKSNVDKRQ